MMAKITTWAAADAAARVLVDEIAMWWQSNLKIVNRKRKVVPLVANRQQLELLYWCAMQMVLDLPVRIQVLKARRMGISTAITALGYMMVHEMPQFTSWACAHQQDGTDTLWGMCKRFREEWTGEVRPTDFSNRTELVYSSPHGSSYRFRTAGGKGIGRSKEISFLHLSEEAFIASAEAFTGLMPCVNDAPMTFILEESTANGVGGEFYDRWQIAAHDRRQSLDDLKGRLGLFFSWLDFPSYVRMTPREQLLPLTDDELALQALGAKTQQLAWRRWTIDQDFNGDSDRFRQEYPATPEEAFISSGRPAIPSAIIAHHRTTAREPVRKVMLSRGKEGEILAHDYDGWDPCWSVWAEPRPGHEYTLGADVAKGLVADPADETSDPDYHAAFILDRRRQRHAAMWHGRCDTDLFGEQCRLAAEWYERIWVGLDMTGGYGMAALVAFRNWPYLYQRQTPMDVTPDKERELARYGVLITSANRDEMIDMYIASARADANHGFDGKLAVMAKELVREEETFIRRKDGKREHRSGTHDDLIFAAIFCDLLHRHCPTLLGDGKQHKMSWKERVHEEGVDVLARTGAVDPGLTFDDD